MVRATVGTRHGGRPFAPRALGTLGRWDAGCQLPVGEAADRNHVWASKIDSPSNGQDRLTVEWTEGGDACAAVTIGEPVSVGTSVRLWFDREIFDPVEFPVERLRGRLGELAGLLPGLHVELNGDEWLFPKWQPGLASVAGATVDCASCEWVELVDDVEIQIRMVLVPPLESSAREDPVVFANYLRMDDKGAFMKRLEEELERLSPDGTLGCRAVVSLTMAGPQISGPTRSRLDDQRTVTALESMFTEHRASLRNVLASEDSEE